MPTSTLYDAQVRWLMGGEYTRVAWPWRSDYNAAGRRVSFGMMLAQSTPEVAPLLLPVLVGMIGIGLLIGLAVAVRKKILKMNEDDGTELGAGFSMGSLRQLVRDGKMTQEEFDAAKARIVAGTQREIDKDAAAKKSLSDVVAARRSEPAATPPDAKIVEHKPPTDELG